MRQLLTIISLGIIYTTSHAQWGVETTLHTSVDDNVNNNYEQLHDNVSQLNLVGGYTLADSNWNTQFFYQGSYNYYNALTDKIFYYHSAGITSTFEGESHQLDFGTTYSSRLNRSAYSFLGYNEFETYIKYKSEPWNEITGNIGYRSNYTSFSELSDLNNLENVFFLNITHQFETKTTAILGGEIGAKWYSVSSAESTVSHAKGSGGIMKSLGTLTSQTSAFIKIGQSLFEKTGISGYARYQVNILNNARSLVNIYSVTDDEIFDTRYGYEGLYYEVSMKQLFSHAIALEIGYSVAEKNYVNSSAYALDGSILSSERNDMRYTFSVELKKGFDIGNGNSLSFSLMYDAIVNSSNDQYYNYSNNVVALQMNVGW